MQQHSKAMWNSFMNIHRYSPCRYELMLIVAVSIWHSVADHQIIQYATAVTMERVS